MAWAQKMGKYILLAVLVSVPVFSHLDTLPLRLWDESRLAMNAYHMYHNGQYLITYFENTPDLWNTKPPLLIWMQVLWMKFIGINEIALRLPSAIAGFITLCIMLMFAVKYLKRFWLGFSVVMVLVTSYGYLFNHSVRLAEYDALLTLFTTMAALAIFVYIETKSTGYLYAFFGASLLAVLTKSIAGVMFFPAIAIYIIVRKEWVALLKTKHFYIGMVMFATGVLTYYLLRENAAPGYLHAVWQNELGGRYTETLELHRHGFWFYFDNFLDLHLSVWYLLVPVGILIGWVHSDTRIRRVTQYFTLLAVQYFLVISLSHTKLSWYDVPLYPLLAFLIALPVFYVFDTLYHAGWLTQNVRTNVFPYIFLFLVFVLPYRSTLDMVLNPNAYPWDETMYDMGYYLKGALQANEDVNGVLYVSGSYDPQNKFYLELLKNKNLGIEIGDYQNLPENTTIISSDSVALEYITRHYRFSVADSINSVTKFHVYGRK